MVAIFNPLVGAAIVAKSLIPSLGMLASKYGLRVAEESLNEATIKRKVKQAEQDVLKQFRGSDVKQHVNPILTITERALRTTESEFDPMLELHSLLKSELPLEERRLVQLAISAVLDVFDKAIQSPPEASKAGLGPEDIRYLKLLRSVACSN